MELSKQEMELFLILPDLQSKNFFYKKFLTFTMESKTGDEKRKWNYPNSKWNYFFYFLTSNKKLHCLKDITPIFQEYLKSVSGMFQGIFKEFEGVKRAFQGCLWVFIGCFKGV